MRPANAALTGGSVLAALLLAVGLSTTTTNSVLAQAGTRGQWRTLTNQVPINPIHLALLRTGEVLIVAGSGNVKTETNFQAAVWDPASQTFLTEAVPWDMFGNGMVTLPDGRVLINSGTLQYDPFFGEPRNAVFDPTTGLVTQIRSMAHGRWYPTVTTLGDGRVMTFSGLLETGGTNASVEILTVGSGWSQEYPAGWTPPLYPRMHLSTDGRVFYAGSTRGSRFFNPSNGTWTPIVATTKYTGTRSYGSSCTSAIETRQRLPAPRDDFWGRQSGDGNDRNHRSLGCDAAVAIRTTNEPAAYRNERDDSAERRGPRNWRINKR